MTLDFISETAEVAKQKYLEYREAVKKRNDPAYKDLKQLYRQLYLGKKLIDIFEVIQKGGLHENFYPKLAVCKATFKEVYCYFTREGDITFMERRNWKKTSEQVILKKCLPRPANTNWSFELTAPVPIIPPSVLPAKLTDDYYILWEVDEWKMIPPTDPWLLKRINERMFVAVAGWNLTALEKSVMASKIK